MKTHQPLAFVPVTVMILAASWIVGGSANAITLARDGQPTAAIVIRKSALAADDHQLQPGAVPTADQKVNLAARDLQEYIEKISGAKLPIVSDEDSVSGALVLVGQSRRSDTLGVEIPAGLTPDRREEGLVLLARGDVLLLAGNEARPYHGTHYAVAELLHRLGVRWFTPSAFGEIVLGQPTITIADMEVRKTPDFPMRVYWSHINKEMRPQEYLWKLRNKMQPDVWGMIEVAGDSSLSKYLPKPDLAKTQPDLFARLITGEPNPFMPNLTNPDTERFVAEAMKTELRARRAAGGNNPNPDWLGFSPNDGAPYDLHPETLKISMGFPAMAGREGVPQEISISEEWFTFANAVAAEVAKEFPDVVLTTTGYSNRDVPPIGIELSPNLSVMYSAIWADNLKALDHPHSWHSSMRGAMLKRWTELSSKVYTYDYFEMLMSCLTPTPVLRRHAADFPLFKEWGLFGFFHERRAAAAIEYGIAPRYFMARLMWDANLDVEAGLREYYRLWYGPAATPAQAFWDALEETMYETPLLGHEDRILPYVYTPQLIQRLENAVARAEELARGEPFITHVKVDRHILEHLKGYCAMHEAEFEGDFAGAVRQADVMFAHREEVHKISPFLHMPERLDRTDGGGRNSGVWYWTLTDRKRFYQDLAGRTGGTTGSLVLWLPRKAQFTLDPGDQGRIEGWYAPTHSRKNWPAVDTTQPYYLQVPGGFNEQSLPYAGAIWYAFECDIPRSASGQSLRFCVPTVSPEAWVWVNGEYVGRRVHKEPYIRPASLDLDIGQAAKPNARNLIVVRVSTGGNRTQAPEGLLSRGFLYIPDAATKPLQSDAGAH
jgi:hypothetical protein